MRNKPDPSAPPPDEEEPPIVVAVPVDPNDEVTASAPVATATQFSTDEDARAAASAAREQGTAIIREHLDQHLSSNPNSSYVTWVATLHPENATVTIDPRFLLPDNPWLTVFREAQQDLQKGGSRDDQERRRVEVATVVPDDVGTERDAGRIKKKSFGGFLDLIIGAALALVGVVAAFTIELCGSYAYLSFWLCSKIASKCSSPVTFITFLPFFVAWLLAKAFLIVDIALLLSSIIVVESIAASSFLICTILACSYEVGKESHQTTRRLAHLTRWACRRHFEEWTPARTTLHCCSAAEVEDNCDGL